MVRDFRSRRGRRTRAGAVYLDLQVTTLAAARGAALVHLRVAPGDPNRRSTRAIAAA